MGSEMCIRDRTLPELLENWPNDRLLIIGDESRTAPPMLSVLSDNPGQPFAFMSGPEGGFAPGELDGLDDLPFVAKVIEPMINTLALKIIHDHGDSGDTILLASATNELIVQPIAKRLDIQNVIGTQVKFINDKCTGEYIPPSALGEGKLQLVQQWMQKNNFDDFSGTTFYSDSINDLPLLEAVDFPKAVNPDAMLEKISLERGWEIIDLPVL